MPLWGDLLDALLNHRGRSRVILTSRRLPRALADHPALLRLPVHALNLREAALLLREMEHTAPLFDDEAGRRLLHRLLAVVQGHPKLLELADRLAVDRAALAERLGDAPDSPEVRAFFATGESSREEADFVAQLGAWAEAAYRDLAPRAQGLLQCLARMEEEDRNSGVLTAVWDEVMEEEIKPAEPAQTLNTLARSGLVELHPTAAGAGLPALIRCTLHPAIAERLRALAAPETLARLDQALGRFWTAQFIQAYENETQGQGRALTHAARHAIPYLLRREEWETASTLLEHLIFREPSPATLAYALPRLERIAEATTGTEREGIDLAILANALRRAGRYPEAERRLRQGLAQAEAKGQFRLASALAGYLLNLLGEQGELDQALALAEKKAEYSRRAGLGPWTRLADEAQYLQILAAQGQYQAVLARVEELRPQLEELPERSEAEETATPWNVRETLLDTGRSAALRLEAWPQALELNAEVLRFKQARGADVMELARTRFNDYGPLLRLGRRAECRSLLETCRQVFAADHEIPGLGKVYSALADLEDKEGRPDRAADFERGALKYRNQAGQPEDCAISHHNLANYLQRRGAPAGEVLAQRLAAAVICYQIGSGGLQTSLRNLANDDLPPQAPSFAEVAASVESIEGVRFSALFANLQTRAPNGDAAIAAVWEGVMALRQAGRQGPDMEQVLAQWAPLLQAIAAVAQGNEEPRPAIEELLPQLEAKGWQITASVHALWSGERDAERLTAGLDDSDSQLVRHLLALLAA